MKRILALLALTCSIAFGQTGGPLTVNSSGAINSPLPASTVLSANGIAPLASPTFTGTVTIPTLSVTTLSGSAFGTGVPAALGISTNLSGGLPTLDSSNLSLTVSSVNYNLSQGALPLASGNSNLQNLRNTYRALDALSSSPQAGSYLNIVETGDSVASFKFQYLLSILSTQYGIGGYGLQYATGITGLTTNTSDFSNYPSGITYTMDSGHTTGVFGYTPIGTVVPFYCKEATLFFNTTTGTGSIQKIQSSPDGTTWTDVTNATISIGVSQTTTGTVTTGNTAIDTNYGSLTSGFAKVTMGSAGKYMFRAIWNAGTVKLTGCRLLDTTRSGVVPSAMAQGGINIGQMDQTPAAILNPTIYELNPTLATFEVKDSVAIFNSDLATWQTLIHGACLNSDFVQIGSTPTLGSTGFGDEIAQAALLKASAKTYNDFFFDSYGVLGSFQAMATMGLASTVQGSGLTSGGTTLTLPAGALSTFAAANVGCVLTAWDAGTNALASGNHLEYLLVTASLGSNQFTITRNYGGVTAGVAHAVGSNIASGWTNDGTHPTTVCNKYLSTQLVDQLRFQDYPSAPINVIGIDPIGIGNSSSIGYDFHLGNATNNAGLYLVGDNGSGSQLPQLFGRSAAYPQGTFPDAHLYFQPSNGDVYFQNSYSSYMGISHDGTGYPEIGGNDLKIGTANIIFTTAGKGIVGGTTSTLPSVGNVGYVVTNAITSGSPVSLTTTVTANVCDSGVLAAGHYLVSFQAGVVSTSATMILGSPMQAAISTTSATLPTTDSIGYFPLALTIASATNSIPVASQQVTLTTSGHIYGVENVTFTAGTEAGFGKLTIIQLP